MRHRATSPSPSSLLGLGAGIRRAAAVLRGRRLGLGVVVLALVTGFVLAAPVVSGPGPRTGVVLDSSSSDSPVVMGLDGRPTSSTFASAVSRLTMGPDGVRVEQSVSRAERMAPRPVPVTLAPPPAETAPPVEAPPPARPAPVAPPAPVETSGSPEPAPVPAPKPTLPAASAPPPPAAAPVGGDRAGQVLALVNEERAAAGCRPVSADGGLTAVAAAHSADMRDRGFFDHVNLAGQSPFDRAEAAGLSARAENIARGQADPAAVMDAWMGSTGHRANILDCSLTRLGVGIADGGGGPWWTQLFA